MLQHLRRERDDLHIPLLAQLAGDGSEDAGGPRLAVVGDQDGGVLVEPDVGAVLAPGLLGRPHDDRPGHVALLHLAGGDGILDRHHHDVAQAGVAAFAAAQHADDERAPGARVVRDPENRFLLDHGYLALSTTSVTRQRTVFASGRVSMRRTVSPARAAASPARFRAFTFLVRVTCFPYTGWAYRRTSETVTVRSILSLVTTPVRVFRRARSAVCGSAMADFLLSQDRLQARDVPPDGAEAHRVLDRLGGGAEAQVEALGHELLQLGLHVVHRQVPDLGRLHRSGLLALHEARPDRQLGGRERQRLLGQVLADAFDLEHHPARLDHGDPALGIALALAHAGLGRLLGDRLVRKDPDPHLAAALHLAGHRHPR